VARRACDLDLAIGAPGPADGPGWTDAALPAGEPALLRGWVEDEARRIAADSGPRPPGHVAASRALHGYLWSACLLFSGPTCSAASPGCAPRTSGCAPTAPCGWPPARSPACPATPPQAGRA
jgi:hypothetical protein